MIFFFEVKVMEVLESKGFNEAEREQIPFSDLLGSFE